MPRRHASLLITCSDGASFSAQQTRHYASPPPPSAIVVDQFPTSPHLNTKPSIPSRQACFPRATMTHPRIIHPYNGSAIPLLIEPNTTDLHRASQLVLPNGDVPIYMCYWAELYINYCNLKTIY